MSKKKVLKKFMRRKTNNILKIVLTDANNQLNNGMKVKPIIG